MFVNKVEKWREIQTLLNYLEYYSTGISDTKSENICQFSYSVDCSVSLVQLKAQMFHIILKILGFRKLLTLKVVDFNGKFIDINFSRFGFFRSCLMLDGFKEETTNDQICQVNKK